MKSQLLISIRSELNVFDLDKIIHDIVDAYLV